MPYYHGRWHLYDEAWTRSVVVILGHKTTCVDSVNTRYFS